jgi:hypothetical protein
MLNLKLKIQKSQFKIVIVNFIHNSALTLLTQINLEPCAMRLKPFLSLTPYALRLMP